MFFESTLIPADDLGTLSTYSPVAYSPDGSKIATMIVGNNIAIWDAATGRKITILAERQKVSGIVFSPNGRLLASFGSTGPIGRSIHTIKIWDTSSGELVRSIPCSGVIGTASFSLDGSRIACNYAEGPEIRGIKIWNTANGSEIRTLVGYTDIVRFIRYSPDGRRILAVSNHEIKIWNAENGQTIRTINGNGETVFANAVYSPDGRHIAIFGNYKENVGLGIRIYNAETGQETITIPVRLRGYIVPMYSPDGRQLLVNASVDNNAVIKIFDLDAGRELRTFNNSDLAIAFSPDGKRILTASTSFTLKLDGKDYGASYATLLDATTGRVTGTIGYGPLNVGARAYMDMQIARFLGNTAEANRHETVLKFITDRGNATHAEIEKFYRDNVRALIAAVVDEEFKGITIPAGTVTYVKDSLTNFYLTPNQANFNVLKSIYTYTNDLPTILDMQETYDYCMEDAIGFERVGRTDLAEEFRHTARIAQNALNTRRRQLNAPNDAPIDWGGFSPAYRRILNGLNTGLVRRM